MESNLTGNATPLDPFRVSRRAFGITVFRCGTFIMPVACLTASRMVISTYARRGVFMKHLSRAATKQPEFQWHFVNCWFPANYRNER
jgi:hypothetical protein